jgi:hypothetical protein
MAQENQGTETTEEVKDVKESKKFKKPSLKAVLISVIAILLLLLIIGITLIIFSPKEEPIAETPSQEVATPTTQEVTQNQEITEEKEPEVKFDLSSINSQKLNEQLANLTNKNIKKEAPAAVENEESRRVLEEQKRIEEESLKIEEDMVLKQKESLEEKKAELEMEMQKLEALKKEAILAREELIKAQNTNIESNEKDIQVEQKPQENIKQENIEETKAKEQNNGEFLQLINVAKIKGTLYKKYLDKATRIDPNILLCRDDLNRIELYYGPFSSNEARETLLNKLLKNGFSQAYELEMTKDEFNKRCKY